jgi:hypothetical protein
VPSWQPEHGPACCRWLALWQFLYLGISDMSSLDVSLDARCERNERLLLMRTRQCGCERWCQVQMTLGRTGIRFLATDPRHVWYLLLHAGSNCKRNQSRLALFNSKTRWILCKQLLSQRWRRFLSAAVAQISGDPTKAIGILHPANHRCHQTTGSK